MKDIELIIDERTGFVESPKRYVIEQENLQRKIIYKFADKFINGIGYLCVKKDDGTIGKIAMTNTGEQYELEIKSGLISNTRKIEMNLRIVQERNEEIPIFVSLVSTLRVKETIVTDSDLPDDYPSWQDTVDKEIEDLQQKDTEQDERLEALEQDNTNNKTNIQANTNNISTLQGTVQTQGQAIQANTQEITNIKSEQTTQNTAITDLENNKANKSDIPDVSNFITKEVNNLTNYELKTNTGSSITLSINSSTYVMTLQLKNSSGTVLSEGTIDLPLETMVVGASYDNVNKKIILTLKNGTTVDFSVADLVRGLVSETQLETVLSAYYTKNEVDNLLSNKVDKVAGKGLSTNDFSNTYKEQVDGNTENIENILLENQRLREDIKGLPSDEAEGESIDIGDSSEMRFKNFEIFGNSKQETRSGKNLFDDTAYRGVKIEEGFRNENVTIELVAGTYNSIIFFEDGTTVNYGDWNMPISLLNANYSQIVALRPQYETEITVGQANQIKYAKVIYNSTGISTYYNKIIKGIMIVKNGEDISEYEQYGVMPSLDYPSEVHSCGDNGSINEVICNKNISPLENLTAKWEGATISIINNELTIVPNSSGGIPISTSTSSHALFLNKGTEITFSWRYKDGNLNVPKGAVGISLKFRFEDDTTQLFNLGDITSLTQNASNSKTITLTKNVKSINWKVFGWNIKEATGTSTYNLQLEIGSKPTPFEQHKEQSYTIPTQQPMREIEDTRDTFILKEDGKWYERHNISYIENYNGESITTAYMSSTGELSTGATVIYINNNPTDIECTAEQTEILNKIYNEAKTYKGGTHIYSTDPVSPHVKVEYMKDIETMFNNISNAVVALGGVI